MLENKHLTREIILEIIFAWAKVNKARAIQKKKKKNAVVYLERKKHKSIKKLATKKKKNAAATTWQPTTMTMCSTATQQTHLLNIVLEILKIISILNAYGILNR